MSSFGETPLFPPLFEEFFWVVPLNSPHTLDVGTAATAAPWAHWKRPRFGHVKNLFERPQKNWDFGQVRLPKLAA